MKYLTRPLLFVLLGLSLLAIVYYVTRSPDQPAIPAAVQQRQDSLVETKPHADSVVAASLDSALAHQRRSEAAAARAQGQQAAAARERVLADSLARVAADAKDAADSATKYRLAYESRTREAAQLIETVASDSTALRESWAANARLRLTIDTVTTRNHALERQNADLAKAAKKAGAGCKVLLGMISCPTRSEAFLVGAVVGVGATVYAEAAIKP